MEMEPRFDVTERSATMSEMGFLTVLIERESLISEMELLIVLVERKSAFSTMESLFRCLDDVLETMLLEMEPLFDVTERSVTILEIVFLAFLVEQDSEIESLVFRGERASSIPKMESLDFLL